MTNSSDSARRTRVQVYLGDSIFGRVSEIAETSGRSHSTICRDLIADALRWSQSHASTKDAKTMPRHTIDDVADQLARLEVYAALTVALQAPQASEGPHSPDAASLKLTALLPTALQTANAILRSDEIGSLLRARTRK